MKNNREALKFCAMNLKRLFTLSALCTALNMIAIPVFAQNEEVQSNEGGGTCGTKFNDAAHPCISAEQYANIEQRISENIKAIKPAQGGARKTTATLFNWPLQTVGITDCGYYYIANYVDQDATAGIRDYNCGSVTYDGHRGTDIALQPYPFFKMDNNEVNVIAAAPGTIIDKSDGHFDKNCAFNTDTANYVIIQHADGSVALYWHMKKTTVTTKTVGMTVTAGEYLGVVGSSGSSTAPHLHFEVWATTLSSSLRDPFTGTCNLLNPSTWWVSQKPYTEPAILKAQVNNVPVVLPGCDTTETPNEDTCFSSGASARFYIFIRNETPGMTVNESILNPDGSVFTSWVHNSISSYLCSYWYMIRTLPTVAGLYMFKTVYNGLTCSRSFHINCGVLDVKPGSVSSFSVYPNPAATAVHIDRAADVIISGMDGRLLMTKTHAADIDVSSLPNGLYLLQIRDESGAQTIQKLEVRH